MTNQSTFGQIVSNLLFDVVGFWFSFAVFVLTGAVLTIYFTGGPLTIIEPAVPLFLAGQQLWLWYFGYRAYDHAPGPKLLFVLPAFVFNALLFALIAPYVTRMSDESATTQVSFLDPAAYIQFVIPYACGAGTCGLLIALKRSRLTRLSVVQKGLLVLPGIIGRLLGIAVVVSALLAVTWTVIPVFAILVTKSRELSAKLSLVLVFLMAVKIIIGLGYIYLGKIVIDSSRRFFFACKSMPTRDPDIFVLRSFDDDLLFTQAAKHEFFLERIPGVALVVMFYRVAADICFSNSRAVLSLISGTETKSVGFVGNPNDSLPRWGSRWYFYDDDDWQSNVKRMLSNASDIIVFVGFREGLAWEIQQIIAGGYLGKTLFLLPPLNLEHLLWLDDDASHQGSSDERSIYRMHLQSRVQALHEAAEPVGFAIHVDELSNGPTMAFVLDDDGTARKFWQDDSQHEDDYRRVIVEFLDRKSEPQPVPSPAVVTSNQAGNSVPLADSSAQASESKARRLPEIVLCPNCGMRVVLKSDGACPSCQARWLPSNGNTQ